MSQTVNIKLINCRDDKFIKTYRINASAGNKTDISFIINETGIVNLYTEFLKENDGLTYCRIFQVYEPGKQSLIYNQPITTLFYPVLQSFYPFIQWKEGQINTDGIVTRGCVLLFDTNGQSLREIYEFENAEQLYMNIKVEYEDQQLQKEADNLYAEVKQKEEYYKMHKAEIDMFRELAAAYDRLQEQQAIS